MEGKLILSEKEVQDAIREWLPKRLMLNGMTRIAGIIHHRSYSLDAEIILTDEPEEVEQPEQAA